MIESCSSHFYVQKRCFLLSPFIFNGLHSRSLNFIQTHWILFRLVVGFIHFTVSLKLIHSRWCSLMFDSRWWNSWLAAKEVLSLRTSQCSQTYTKRYSVSYIKGYFYETRSQRSARSSSCRSFHGRLRFWWVLCFQRLRRVSRAGGRKPLWPRLLRRQCWGMRVWGALPRPCEVFEVVFHGSRNASRWCAHSLCCRSWLWL